MSRENVEVVRRIWDVSKEGIEQENPGAVAALFDQGLLAPEATFTPAREVTGSDKTYVGREGLLDSFAPGPRTS